MIIYIGTKNNQDQDLKDTLLLICDLRSGADPAGEVLGVRTPPPPKLHKEGRRKKNVMCVRENLST